MAVDALDRGTCLGIDHGVLATEPKLNSVSVPLTLARLSQRLLRMVRTRAAKTIKKLVSAELAMWIFKSRLRGHCVLAVALVVSSVSAYGIEADSGGRSCRDLVAAAEQSYLEAIRQARWTGNSNREVRDSVGSSDEILVNGNFTPGDLGKENRADFGIQNWEKADLSNSKVAAEVFELYSKTYKDFGMVLSDPGELAKKRIALVLRDGHHKVVAFQLARHDRFGLLLTQVGGDGSRFSRTAILHLLHSRLPEGVYLQTAGVPLRVIYKNHVNPIVSFLKASEIRRHQGREIRPLSELERSHAVEQGDLLNENEILDNGYVTTVRYNGKVQEVIKVMVGRPLPEDANTSSLNNLIERR